MSRILDLLKEKNFHLEKFLEESRKKRTQFKARHFENLQSLYEKREKILFNIQNTDRKINTISNNKASETLNPPKKNEMIEVLRKIRTNVSDIMEEDLQIISCIDNEKSEIIRKMRRKKTIKGGLL